MQIKRGVFQVKVTAWAKTGLDFSIGLYFNGLFPLFLHFSTVGGVLLSMD